MQTFRHCFNKEYWKCAAAEFKNLRSVILCALFVALRIAVKSLRVPIAPNLNITFDFVVNSLGSMMYGPLLALVCGAISDTIGFLIFPSGPYFFPFIFVEMASAFIFALYFYRAKLSQPRIILARFTVSVVCNLVLNPLIMAWQASLLGGAFNVISVVRVIKNLVLLAPECLILTMFLGLIARPLAKMGYVAPLGNSMKINAATVLLSIAVTLIAVGGVLLYVFAYLPNK